jgi:hypothetical protein
MMDTQNANFPEEKKVELEGTNVPENNPDETTDVIVAETTTVEVNNDSEVATSNSQEPERPDAPVAEETKEDDADSTAEIKAEEKDETPSDSQPDDANASDADNARPESKMTKSEIIDKLSALLSTSGASRDEVDKLKQAFYKIHNQETDELKKKFIEDGGDENDFHAPDDPQEHSLKELLNDYKAKKASRNAEDEQLKAANYALKLQLIERLKQICESPDDFNKLYNEFKEIQQRWKETKSVPQEHANELWKNYQIYNERFYDLIKINHQLRDYDFRKNLETKTALCEAVEKLAEETDIISAFHKLQKLHAQWRETGPVTKELREDIWTRFKEASSVINKRHQLYYEERRGQEDASLEEKTAICEQIESIDYSKLTTYKEWEAQQKEILEYQRIWKTIGPAPRKFNNKIYDRFRKGIDLFFKNKSEYSKEIRKGMDKNLELKNALCERAEALKESTDWKETSDAFIALQKEWKAIGPVPNKFGETVWKRFITACDYFFERKLSATSSNRETENNNLAAKKEIIARIKEINNRITGSEPISHNDALAQLKECTSEWNGIGYVPYRDKDKLNDEFRDAVETIYDRLKINRNDRKLQDYRSNISELGERGKGKLYGERDKLMRNYERLKSELQTYENNIGFLNVSSKGGGGLLKEMNNKMEKLKEDMRLLIKKIEAIDENL